MGLKLKYIDLQNFQGYKRARIPLTDFTIMVGKSSAGKTTIFRAMMFLLYGEWDNTYPNDPTKATAVAVEFENGTRVLRIRKDGQNQAAIIRDGETTKFRSFGSSIPGIHSLINAKPIEIGTKTVNLNFSLQDDPTFMLSESRPTRAQWIGRLYGAHIINQMLREMAKDKKHADSKRKDAEDRLIGIEAELKGYATIEEQEALLGQVEALLASYNHLQACAIDANVLQVNKDSYNRDKWVLRVDTKGLLDDIEKLVVLQLVKEDYDIFQKNKSEFKILLEATKINVGELRQNVEKLADLVLTKMALEGTEFDSGEFEAIIETGAKKIKKARGELNAAILSGNACPVCGAPIEKDHTRIFNNIARLVGSQTNAD